MLETWYRCSRKQCGLEFTVPLAALGGSCCPSCHSLDFKYIGTEPSDPMPQHQDVYICHGKKCGKRFTMPLIDRDGVGRCPVCGSVNFAFEGRILVALGPDKQEDAVEHPKHYGQHPSGVECITITQEFNFNLGNVIKYVWRAGLKESSSDIEDLKKAQQYLKFEINRREGKEPLA